LNYVRTLEHMSVVVHDLEAATEFFLDIGLERDGATSPRTSGDHTQIGSAAAH